MLLFSFEMSTVGYYVVGAGGFLSPNLTGDLLIDFGNEEL